jgi:hypothetical protein
VQEPKVFVDYVYQNTLSLNETNAQTEIGIYRYFLKDVTESRAAYRKIPEIPSRMN